jgi:pimeloyl-ACP methyl ester carboxylesterase
VVLVPGRGEIFVRDSGPETAKNGTVLLLHGWMFGGDLNWLSCFMPLQGAGYRVISVDHRGHGRGIRSQTPFRLTDCAEDYAELLSVLGTGPVTVVGYSMGGPIAQILALRHPEVVAGVVLSATTDQWTGTRRMRNFWRTMRLLEFALTHTQRRVWRSLLRRNGRETSPEIMDWLISELQRNDPKAVAEAGREMGRFDSRSWIAQIEAPVAVIVHSRDRLVPPSFQRDMARHIPGAYALEVEGDHVAVGMQPERYVPVLLEALADVGARERTTVEAPPAATVTQPVAAATGS